MRAEESSHDHLNRVVVADYHERMHARARPQSLREEAITESGVRGREE